MPRRAAAIIVISVFLFLHSPTIAPAQEGEPATRDPQAMAILTLAASAAGASGVQDFTGTGTITYYWADEEVKGPVIVRGRGKDEFRLDASLPEGPRSVVVGRGQGQVTEPDGKVSRIAHHNALNQAAVTFPLSRIAAALSDASFSLTYDGVVDEQGVQVHRVRVIRQAQTPVEARSVPAELRTTEFLVSASTGLVVSMRDTIHSDRNVKEGYSRELHFSDYRLAGGAWVPFSVAEDFAGQRTWSLQLDAIAFNSGLKDVDFSF